MESAKSLDNGISAMRLPFIHLLRPDGCDYFGIRRYITARSSICMMYVYIMKSRV